MDRKGGESMAGESFSSSSLSWLWTIEALASSKGEADTSLITNLAKFALENSDDLRKDVKTEATLRVLENSSAQVGVPSNGSAAAVQQSQTDLDPSEGYEDVLRLMVYQTSAPKLAEQQTKWDVESLLAYKRECCPTFALKELKDVILKSNDPCLASLRELSGLSVNVIGHRLGESKDSPATTAIKETDSVAHEDGNDSERSPVGNILPSKRVCNVHPHGDQVQSDEDQLNFDSGFISHSNAAKKLKHDHTSTEQDVIHHSVSPCGNELIEDPCYRIAEHIRKEEGCDLSKEFEARGVEESRIPENGHNVDSTSKSLGHIDHVEQVNVLHNQSDFCCNNGLVSQDPSAIMQEQNISVDEAKKCIELSVEFTKLDVVPEGMIQKKMSVDTAQENCKHRHQNIALDDALPAKAQHDLGQNISVDEAKKCIELSVEFTKLDVVPEGMIQKKMSVDTAQENCEHRHQNIALDDALPAKAQHDLGQNVSVDEAKKCIELSVEFTKLDVPEGMIQKKTSVDTAQDNCEHRHQNIALDDALPAKAQHDLVQNHHNEISNDENGYHDEQTSDSSSKFQWSEQRLCLKCDRGDNVLFCSADACPIVIHENCLGNASGFDEQGNFYCPFCAYSRAISLYQEVERKASLARKKLMVFIGSGIEGHSQKFFNKSEKIENQTRLEKMLNEIDLTNNGKDAACEVEGSSAIDGTVHTSAENKQEGNKTIEVCESPRRLHDQQTTVLAVHMSEVCESSRGLQNPLTIVQDVHNSDAVQDMEIAHASKIDTEIVERRDVPLAITSLLHEPESSSNMDAYRSSEQENDKPFASKYSTRFQKQESRSIKPPIPQFRRRKFPFTKEEEDAIKEGAKLFLTAGGKKIQWKKVLEYGKDVFQEGRSAIDLKDKWRKLHV